MGEVFDCAGFGPGDGVPCYQIISLWAPGIPYAARPDYGFEVGGDQFATAVNLCYALPFF